MEWIQVIWSSEWSSYHKGGRYLTLSLTSIVGKGISMWMYLGSADMIFIYV
jgi:hypothetical protein